MSLTLANKKSDSRPNYESWIHQKVKITELFLDPQNIRLQIESKSSPSQDALINDLFVNEKAIQILENIAKNGFLPDEFPVVLKEKSKFTVIDGNRRVAALKVLARPEIVPQKETQIKELLKNAQQIPHEIEVVIAPNREETRYYLASKHTQNTRRPWRPLRQAYFYKAELDRGKTIQDLRNDYPGVDIAKFLRLINFHKIAKSIEYDSKETTKRVHNERSFPASTIERFYEAKQARDFLGFEFDNDGEIKVHVAQKEFQKGIKKVIQDAADKVIDTRILHNEVGIAKYLKSFNSSETPKKTKIGKVLTSNDFKEILPSKDKKRTKLAPGDINFTLQAPGVKRMLTELQNIDYRKFPNAAHDLLRSFLECSLKAYFDQQGTPVKPRKGKYVFLNDVLQEFKKEMDKKNNTQLSQVTQRILSNTKMTSYSAEFLNATNHNPSVFAVKKDVEDAWDAMEKMFRYILHPTKK